MITGAAIELMRARNAECQRLANDPSTPEPTRRSCQAMLRLYTKMLAIYDPPAEELV